MGLIDKSVEIRHGPAAVKVSRVAQCHWSIPGRRSKAMNLSQKNCLIHNHRLTCERWEWRLSGLFLDKLP